ncbi:MAG: proton-conducting transporter membrane subunit [Planctomycetia bacterium]|nr:proton-conducting transporter membrane subunit [Planctomycetia bacterium]
MIIGLIFILPLLALVVAVGGAPLFVAGWISALAALADVIIAAVLAAQAAAGTPLIAIPHWLGANAFGALILLLETMGALTALIFSIGFLSRHSAPAGRKRRYLIWFNLFLIALYAVPLLREIALVWLALTLTTLFSVFLVSFERTPAALEAGWKYALLTTLGAAIAILGILLLYWAQSRAGFAIFTWGQLQASAPKLSPAILNAAFLLILIGLGTKAALIPFHAWLPDTYSRAPFPICAMLSILESAAIPYVLLRLAAAVHLAPGARVDQWLILFGLVSAGGAALLILQTHEYKRLFAYSTIENAGIILTAGAMASTAARHAAIWQIISHGLTKPLVFYAAGIMFMLAGKLRINEVRGVLSRSAWIGATLMVAGLAVAGAPPFAIFLSELAILKAGLASPQAWAAILLACFMIISFCAITYHLFRMVLGRPAMNETEMAVAPITIPLSCIIALLIAAVPVLVLGWYIPAPLAHWLAAATASLGGGRP